MTYINIVSRKSRGRGLCSPPETGYKDARKILGEIYTEEVGSRPESARSAGLGRVNLRCSYKEGHDWIEKECPISTLIEILVWDTLYMECRCIIWGG